MTDYKYDPDLPYVVELPYSHALVARFTSEENAYRYAMDQNGLRVIDTTPKPRVPDDARFIAWTDRGDRWFAERTPHGWEVAGYGLLSAIEHFPGVTPDTVFTVLDERKS